VPIEVGVLVVGYRHSDRVYHRLPPQPPLSLDVIYTCPADELLAFTQRFDYFRLVLDNRAPAGRRAAGGQPALRRRGPRRGRPRFSGRRRRELARLLAVESAQAGQYPAEDENLTDTTLDDWFPRTPASPEAAEQARRLGIVSAGR